MPARDHRSRRETAALFETTTSRWLPWLVWGVLFVAALIPAAPLVPQYGFLFLSMGLLMILFPPRFAIPRWWGVCAGLFLLAGLAPFLPAAWFTIPAWRKSLEAAGVPTGSHVVIQWQQAIEQQLVFAVMIAAGLWLAGHRVASASLKNLALAFVTGVAVYAVLAEWLKEMLPVHTYQDHFGFFPNRNHSGTYLALGATCGLGLSLQSVRTKEFWRLALSLIATGICVWAVFGWSISRAGVILCAIGFSMWAALLGRRYWGRNEIKAVALIALLAVGAFLVAETKVKTRLTATTDKLAVAAESASAPALGGDTGADAGPVADKVNSVDFRVPIALDAFQMIRSEPWTGVGAGQFRFVFPQYRHLSAWVNDSECLHPENDWLWMAAEVGVPATLLLAALVIGAFGYGLKNVLHGRDRALRMGCLVAAALVPIHGCFDVPGHRPALAWTAVFLFVLALNPPESSASRMIGKSGWLARGAGVLIAVAGLRLFAVSWFGFTAPAMVRARDQFEKASTIYRSIEAAGPQAAGPAIDARHDQIRRLVDEALVDAPLDHQLYYLRGLNWVSFADQREAADRAFGIQCSLAPMWVKLPYHQALAWVPYDLARVSQCWRESLSRARRLDRITPDSASSFDKTAALIRRFSKRNPILQQVAEDAIRSNFSPR